MTATVMTAEMSFLLEEMAKVGKVKVAQEEAIIHSLLAFEYTGTATPVTDPVEEELLVGLSGAEKWLQARINICWWVLEILNSHI